MREIKCITTGEVVYSYRDYLKTEHWKNIRKLIRKKYNNKCKNCKTSERLEVHHKTYRNIGNELLSNLVLLCRDCHQQVHDQSNSNKQMLEDKRTMRSVAFNYIKDKYKIKREIQDIRFFMKRRNSIVKVNESFCIKLSRSLKTFYVYNKNEELIEKINIKKVFKNVTK